MAAARVQDAPLRRALLAHLGPQAATWPVLTASWPAFDQVNVQLGVEAWLASPGRAHELLGVTGARYWQSGLADLLSDGPPDPLLGSPGVGSVTTEPRPAGPGGATHPCVSCGVYLIEDRGERFALLLRGPEDGSPDEPVRLQVAGASQARAGQLLGEVRRLAAEHNVYRGQVLSFDAEDCAAAGSRPRVPGPAAGRPGRRGAAPGRAGRHRAAGGRDRPARHRAAGQRTAPQAAAFCCMARPGPARRTRCATCSASCPG